MTTLNTIIEEEKDEVTKQLDITLPPCDEVITGGHFLDVQKAIHTLITSAMQRAYEAGREERDTYWKERVRKTVGKIEESARTQDTSYEYGEGTYEGMMHSIFILKDITNEDNLK